MHRIRRWQWRWRRAWDPGGLGVRLVLGAAGLLLLPPAAFWSVRTVFATGLYYTLGSSLEAVALGAAAIPAIIILLVLGRASMGEGSRGLLVVAPVVLLVSWIAALGAMTLLNGALDTSDPRAHDVEVLDHSFWCGPRYRHLRVASWRPGERDVKVWVDLETCLRRPARVTVTTRRGALGFEWVESVRE
ncbi:MAG: hypothetical protein IT372_21705 [Polyangiaceae bacterium]|nr:hypothetical protein [Polyangiaceae bacterium]